MKRFAFIVCCLFLFVPVEGQTFKTFSGDDATFLEECKQYFLSDRNAEKKQKEKAIELVGQFSVFFNTLSREETVAFLNMCSAALNANMRPFPTFENVLKSAVSFYTSGQYATSFYQYVRALTMLAENRKMRDFDSFLKSTNRLFETGFIYESMSAKWYVDGEWLFEFYESKPRFVFLKTNLTCYANRDSTKVHLTQGAFYPLQSLWEGKTGLVDFARAGYDLNEMFIQLNEYVINLKTSRYQADSVNFFNKIYFQKPMFGRMEEKVLPNVKVGQASYPRFVSYESNLKIDNLFPNVDFEGQYMQMGSRVKCGEKEETALLKFRQNDEIILTVLAKNFIFGRQRISTPLAEVRIPLDDGEILHSTCEVRYDDTRRELSVLHPAMNAFKNPIHNSYHELDMYVEAIYWQIDSTQMEFRMLKIPNHEGIGVFESKQFFSAQDIQVLMEQIDYNPLFVLRKMSEEFRTETLLVSSVADYFRQDVTQTKVMLLRMASMGFLRYDAENETVVLQDKLFHFLQASAKRADYDILRIVSQQTDTANAILDIKTRDLSIFGVEKIDLSTAQNVYVIPDRQSVIVKKNRDFTFKGTVHCGKFDFIASSCYFDYDQFKIAMDTVEILEFSVKHGTPDIYGNYSLKAIETAIEQLAGEILIDSVANKSGKDYYPQYPIFTSNKDSYVRYDKPDIQNGVYTFDKFFYTIYPFKLERLNNFETDKLKFEGHLTSSGMFPDIFKELRVMPDFSLGFETVAPDSAWPVYQGRGKFYDTLYLSNDGLIGSGKLDFLTSTNFSDRFIFMPDSVNAIIQVFDVEAQSIGAEFPTAAAKLAQLHWRPYRNFFSTTNNVDGFSIFDDEIVFYGELILADTGMIANGRAVFKTNTEMQSEKFVVKNRELISDQVKFGIKSKDGKITAIESKDYSVRVNFDEQKGYLQSNHPDNFVGFPFNQYVCYMNELEWDMKTNLVLLKNSKKSSYTDEQLNRMTLRELVAIGDDLPGSDFVSQHARQDSLRFRSPVAEYNLETTELELQQVRIIYTADIAVQPEQGNILIGKDAVMKSFGNANLLIAVENGWHDIHDAEVTIQGRTKYTASGIYNYQDVIGDRQPIRFEKISPDRDGISTGTTKIDADSNFAMSPAFNFAGQITLRADDSLLQFSGQAMINHICEEEDNRTWFNFTTFINPKQVEIPITELSKEKTGKRVGSGFYLTNQGDLFPAFLTAIKSTDKIVMNKSGVLFYDSVRKAYVIQPLEQETNLESEQLIYNTADCSLKAYGTPNFNLDLGRVGLANFGTLYHNYRDASTLFDGVIGLKFFFDEKALEQFSASLEKAEGDGAEQSIDKFMDYVYAELPQRDAERALREIETYGALRRIPSELEQTILLSDVKMQWDNVSRSFVSMGKLGIATVGENQINKYVNGTLQIIKSRRGDAINLYVEISRREWYFFSYSDGLMQVISSDEDFNDAILMLKASKRKQKKGGEGSGSYEFDLSSMRKKTDFVFKTNAIRNAMNEEEESEEDNYENRDEEEGDDEEGE
ncbi:MAG: hypothetical protein LBU91_07090 [Bacteroidales bacterium]|jgi:hypothetical protein|nr:hypothetical protein [Bacteroidales bacterium]